MKTDGTSTGLRASPGSTGRLAIALVAAVLAAAGRVRVPYAMSGVMQQLPGLRAG